MPYSEVAGQEPDDADAHLIANAPEWLRFLLDELERLEREYAEERAAHNAHVAELCELEKENRKLRGDIERMKKQDIDVIISYAVERQKLIEVLRWYADEDTHMIKRRSDGDYAPIVLDHGKRARDILREVGVTVE